jgi:hypothetical protein
MPYLHRCENPEYRTWNNACSLANKNRTNLSLVLTKWLKGYKHSSAVYRIQSRCLISDHEYGRKDLEKSRQKGKLRGMKGEKRLGSYPGSTSSKSRSECELLCDYAWILWIHLSKCFDTALRQNSPVSGATVLRNCPSLWATRTTVVGLSKTYTSILFIKTN